MSPHHTNTERTCLNCGHVFKGKYCNHCGQDAEVEKITFSHLVHEFFHFLTHHEKGFLHTVWHFLVKPGTASLNFIKGKRKEYQKPVSYILILTGLYILIHNYVINRYHYKYDDPLTTGWADPLGISVEQANMYLRTHFTPFVFIILLAATFVIYIMLGRKVFNFVEVLTLSLYGGGTYFMMLAVSDITLGMIFRVNIISMNVFFYQTLLSSVYNLWFSYGIFKKARVNYLWPRLITVSLLIAVIGYAIMNYLPLLWV